MTVDQITHDSIISELHATRERLAEQYHNDLLAFSKAAELHCLALGFEIIEGRRHQPQPPPEVVPGNI